MELIQSGYGCKACVCQAGLEGGHGGGVWDREPCCEKSESGLVGLAEHLMFVPAKNARRKRRKSNVDKREN